MIQSKRLLALDVMRGMTIAGMILVNNPGSWGHIYAPLRHAKWNGLTPTDLVFPFFMFMMGMAMYISMKKYDFRLNGSLLRKILRRSATIFLIGVAIHALSKFLWGFHDGGLVEAFEALKNTRILGVLQRLAICSGICSLIVVTCRHRFLPYIIGGLLVVYTFILMVGNGYVYGPENILSIVDRAVIGLPNMYNDHHIEPEGLLSTLPSVAHVLIGFCIGKITMEVKDMKEKLNRLFVWGAQLTFSGWLLSYACPINKKVWSPTFVLVTCGLACLLIGLLLVCIDEKKTWKRTSAFEVFGVNPLFCYVLSQVFAILASYPFFGGTSLHHWLYNDVLCGAFGEGQFASLFYALFTVSVVWLAGLYLYRKRIYIKI